MRRILIVIYICCTLTFTACGNETNSTKQSDDTTKNMEESTETPMDSISHTEEMNDEEYLVNLGKQLKLGMSMQDIINKIGEPDEYMGSGILYLIYNRGSCSLNIMVGSPYGSADDIYVYNKKTDQSISIYSYSELGNE